MGSRKAIFTAAKASDKARCVRSGSKIDWQSMRSFLNHATWLTDLQQPGKLPNELIDAKASDPIGWIVSRSSKCIPVKGSPNSARQVRDCDFDVTSTTGPTLLPQGMQLRPDAVV